LIPVAADKRKRQRVIAEKNTTKDLLGGVCVSLPPDLKMSDPTKFAEPVTSFDVHIYFFQGSERSVQSAARLREEILQTFPDFEVYKLHTTPIGTMQ
jgi:hypothetical protein